MKQTKILKLLNNLTTYEKLELVNKLIHSDQVQISLGDDQAIMIHVNLEEFEPSAYQSSEIAEQYGKSRLVSTPEKENL